MILLLPLAVLALAAVGAVVRWQLGIRLNRAFPVGTLAANVVASFALGLLSAQGETTRTLLGIGLLGALSTWSTLANEIAELVRAKRGWLAAVYLTISLLAGVGAALLGLRLV